MLEPGVQIPDVSLFTELSEPVRLRDLAAAGPMLLVFYLYDWTST